jgi:hypothetical protein
VEGDERAKRGLATELEESGFVGDLATELEETEDATVTSEQSDEGKSWDDMAVKAVLALGKRPSTEWQAWGKIIW